MVPQIPDSIAIAVLGLTLIVVVVAPLELIFIIAAGANRRRLPDRAKYFDRRAHQVLIGGAIFVAFFMTAAVVLAVISR